MKIDDAILEAVKKAVEKHNNVFQFSKTIEIAHTTVAAWLNGTSDRINSKTWENLFPAIKCYLPKEMQRFYSDPVLTTKFENYSEYKKITAQYGQKENEMKKTNKTPEEKPKDLRVVAAEIVKEAVEKIQKSESPFRTGQLVVGALTGIYNPNV